MDFTESLDDEPLFEITRYRSSAPQDAVAFTGTIRKHPYDSGKCLLLADPLPSPHAGPHAGPHQASPAGAAPSILEFNKTDVLGVEELASPVDESGHPRQVLRLWIRRGSLAIRYEPFEVDEPPRFIGAVRLREHVLSTSGPKP